MNGGAVRDERSPLKEAIDWNGIEWLVFGRSFFYLVIYLQWWVCMVVRGRAYSEK
jgi:hypothetical protein